MESSPLTQQTRPESFQPKIVQLYQDLLKQGQDARLSDGFWREFFLLQPSLAELRRILAGLSVDNVLDHQVHTQSLFSRAVAEIKAGRSPSDENALDTLTAFLVTILSKRYTNPSSDVINVLAGLDRVDAVFTDFVNCLDALIRHNQSLKLRRKAINVGISIASGAYKTGLLTYFTHRDSFPAIIKYIQDVERPEDVMEPFLLLGILANYNKFEFQNPYRVRLGDFVNENVIKKVIDCVGRACASARDAYVAIQDDSPEEWSVAAALEYIGLGNYGPGKKNASRTISEETAKAQFAALPPHDAAVLLPTYDFANANKLFCYNLASQSPPDKQHESPLAAYLSLTSYLVNHAHRSTRASLYAQLNLLIVRILVEDQALCKRLCASEGERPVRLCRQRQPFLPLVRAARTPASVILDIAVDGINHNLKRKLDVDLYLLCVGIILRMLSSLGRSRTRLAYHWSELWRSLLSFVRFLTSYVSSLKSLSGMDNLLDTVVNVIALALSSGDAFLPGAADYDDLFYKIIETGDVLVKFRDMYNLSNRPTNAIPILISVVNHYTDLLSSSKSPKNAAAGSTTTTTTTTTKTSSAKPSPDTAKSSPSPSSSAQANSKPLKKDLSPKQIIEVIRTNYDSLSIPSVLDDRCGEWPHYREQLPEERVFVKKMVNLVVGGDVRTRLAFSG